jgi:hypothetical protein
METPGDKGKAPAEAANPHASPQGRPWLQPFCCCLHAPCSCTCPAPLTPASLCARCCHHPHWLLCFLFSSLPPLSPAAPAPITPWRAARRARYLSRVLDASFNVLFDGRRRTTHTLVYNYFMVRPCTAGLVLRLYCRLALVLLAVLLPYTVGCAAGNSAACCSAAFSASGG